MTYVVPAIKPLAEVSLAMFEEQRRRVTAALAPKIAPGGVKAIALLEGASDIPRNNTDTNFVFRQESFFMHLFGYESADCYGSVEIPSGHSTIYIPRLPSSNAVWMGPLPTCEEVRSATGVDSVLFSDEMAANLSARQVSHVLVLNGINTDSGLPIAPASVLPSKPDGVVVDDTSLLYDTLVELRVRKTKLEQALLKKINDVSCRAHVAVMRLARPGLSQHHLESLFQHHCYYTGGHRQVSYSCICATGADAAILHYISNNHELQDGDMALLDMGGEYKCYASDITCAFPVNGSFTPVQRVVYEGVLDAHDAVIAAIKPGVSWPEMHKLALLRIAAMLRREDLIRASDDDVLAHELMHIFMPHGLGHLIGLDVHDVGGYAPGTPQRSMSLSFSKLRTARTLESGIYITVEPGCYFNRVLLEEAFADPVKRAFFNEEKLRQPQYWNFGGVRIESNILVTEDGAVNFTDVPRRVEDVEAVMAGRLEWHVDS